MLETEATDDETAVLEIETRDKRLKLITAFSEDFLCDVVSTVDVGNFRGK